MPSPRVAPFAPLSPPEQHALLSRIVERCARRPGAPPPVIVFDLDGTLMDNRPRTSAILHELAGVWGDRRPRLAQRLANVTPAKLAYLLTHSLEALEIHESDAIAEAEVFWRERFFSDDYLTFDQPVPGSVAFARRCYETGGNLVYLTGRDLPLMGVGSFRSLRDLGFPIGLPGTELVLKPDAAMPDEAFKRLEAPKLGRVGEVVAVFDNEPANCNLLLAQHPEAESVFVDTQHLPGAPPLVDQVHVVADFRMQA